MTKYLRLINLQIKVYLELLSYPLCLRLDNDTIIRMDTSLTKLVTEKLSMDSINLN